MTIALPTYLDLAIFLAVSLVALWVSKFMLDRPLYDGPHWTKQVAFYLWQASRASMWMIIAFAVLRVIVDKLA